MQALLTMMFKGESNNALIQLFRYVIMGGISFVVDFSTFYILYQFCGVHYLVAATIGQLLGLATIYTSSIIWVFDERTVKNAYVEFGIFATLGLIGTGITLLLMYLFVGVLELPAIPSRILAAGLAFGWNFLSRKLLLFTSFGASRE
jgi:putative flippase GtrA